jgi:hypothetical protein
MLIVHRVVGCLCCRARIEVFDDDFERGDVTCPFCGYLIEFHDNRVVVYEEIW